MTPQRPVGSCCRECRFENALDVATSAKYSLRPVAGSPVASCYCATGSGCDVGDGAQGDRKLLHDDAGAGLLVDHGGRADRLPVFRELTPKNRVN